MAGAGIWIVLSVLVTRVIVLLGWLSFLRKIFEFKCPVCGSMRYRTRQGGVVQQSSMYGGDTLRWLNQGCDCKQGLNHIGEVPDWCGVLFEEAVI